MYKNLKVKKFLINRYFLGKDPYFEKRVWLGRKRIVIKNGIEKRILSKKIEKVNVLFFKKKGSNFYIIAIFFGKKLFYQMLLNLKLFKINEKITIPYGFWVYFLFISFLLERFGLIRNCDIWTY